MPLNSPLGTVDHARIREMRWPDFFRWNCCAGREARKKLGRTGSTAQPAACWDRCLDLEFGRVKVIGRVCRCTTLPFFKILRS